MKSASLGAIYHLQHCLFDSVVQKRMCKDADYRLQNKNPSGQRLSRCVLLIVLNRDRLCRATALQSCTTALKCKPFRERQAMERLAKRITLYGI